MTNSFSIYPKFIGNSNDVNQILSNMAEMEGYHGKIVLRNEKYYFVDTVEKGDTVLKLSQIMDIFIKNPKTNLAGTLNQRKERLKDVGVLLQRKESKLNDLSPIIRKIYNWIWKTESNFKQEKNLYDQLKEQLSGKENQPETRKEEERTSTSKKDRSTQPRDRESSADTSSEKTPTENAQTATEDSSNATSESAADLERSLVSNTVFNEEMAREDLKDLPVGSYRVWSDGKKVYLFRKIIGTNDQPTLVRNVINYDSSKNWIAKIREFLTNPSKTFDDSITEDHIEKPRTSKKSPSSSEELSEVIDELFFKNIVPTTQRKEILAAPGFKKLAEVVKVSQIKKYLFGSPEEDQLKIFNTLKSIGEKLAAGPITQDEYVAEEDERVILKKDSNATSVGSVEAEMVREKSYAYIITKENEIYIIHKELTRGGTKIISNGTRLNDFREFIHAAVKGDAGIAEAQKEIELLNALATSNCPQIVKPYFVKILGKGKSGQSTLVMLQRKYAGDGYKLKNQEPQKILDAAIDWAEGLNFLHRKAFVHVDVKPGNFLIEEENGKVKGKVSDFGLSNRIGEKFVKSTAYFLPPEGLVKKDDRLAFNTDYTLEPSFDCFSFGICLFYLAANVKKPLINDSYFGQSTQKEIDDEINKQMVLIRDDTALSEKDKNTKLNLLMVAKGLLKVNPKERMNMEMTKDALKGIKNPISSKTDQVKKSYSHYFVSKASRSDANIQMLNNDPFLFSLLKLIRMSPSDVNGMRSYVFKEDKEAIEAEIDYTSAISSGDIRNKLKRKRFHLRYDRNVNDALIKLKYYANLIDKESGNLHLSNPTPISNRPYLMMEQIGVTEDEERFIAEIRKDGEGVEEATKRWKTLSEKNKDQIKANGIKQELKNSLQKFLQVNRGEVPGTLLVPFNYHNHSMFLTIERDKATGNWNLAIVDSQGNSLEKVKENVLEGVKEILHGVFGRRIRIDVHQMNTPRIPKSEAEVHFQLDAVDMIKKIEAGHSVYDLMKRGEPIFTRREEADLEGAIKKDQQLANSSLVEISSQFPMRFKEWLSETGMKFANIQSASDAFEDLIA